MGRRFWVPLQAHCARAVGRKMDAAPAHETSAVAVGCVVVCGKGLVAACVTPPAPKGAVPAGVFRRGSGREQWQAGYVFIGGSTPLPACAAAEPASAGISGGGGSRENGGGAKTPVGYAASGQPRGALGTENGESGNWVAGAASVCPTKNVCSGKGGDFVTPFVCTRGDHAGGLQKSL